MAREYDHLLCHRPGSGHVPDDEVIPDDAIRCPPLGDMTAVPTAVQQQVGMGPLLCPRRMTAAAAAARCERALNDSVSIVDVTAEIIYNTYFYSIFGSIY